MAIRNTHLLSLREICTSRLHRDWRSVSARIPRPISSPTALPEDLQKLLGTLTSSEQVSLEVGRRAAIEIARIRRRTGSGPTFAELFDPIFLDAAAPSSDLAKGWDSIDRSHLYALRHHLAVHLRRDGWIQWSGLPRSLRTGVTFSRASRLFREARAAKDPVGKDRISR